METGPDGRKKVDLSKLPRWAQWSISLLTIVVVSAIALLVGKPETGTTVPLSAIVAAFIAFALVAWRAQR